MAIIGSGAAPDPKPDGGPASPNYPEFWAIRFKIVSPAPHQIYVTAECCHPPVRGYPDRLLEDKRAFVFFASFRAFRDPNSTIPQFHTALDTIEPLC